MPNRRDEIENLMQDAYNAHCRRNNALGDWNEFTDGFRDGYAAQRRELLEGLRRDVEAIETDRTFHEYKLGFKNAKTEVLALLDEAQSGGNAENTQPVAAEEPNERNKES